MFKVKTGSELLLHFQQYDDKSFNLSNNPMMMIKDTQINTFIVVDFTNVNANLVDKVIF